MNEYSIKFYYENCSKKIFFLVGSPFVYVLGACDQCKAEVRKVSDYHGHNTFI